MRKLESRKMICPNCQEDTYFQYEANPYSDTLIQRWHCPICHANGTADVLDDEQEKLEQEMWDEAASVLDSVNMYQPFDEESYSFTGTHNGRVITIQIALNK